MLSRFEYKDGFWPVPNTDCNLFVTKEGLVKGKGNNFLTSYVDQDFNVLVNVFWYDGFRPYKVDELVAHTFKHTCIPVEDWNKMYLLHKDNNNLNVHASNLIWKFTVPIESRKFHDFYYIPGYTRFLINKDCNSIDSISGGVRTLHYKDDYVYYSVKPDVGSWTLIGRHRLLCLAFKDYESNINKMDVNHIDGIPGNDTLENLEFITRRGNNLHAIKLGLKICKQPVKKAPILVRCIKTNIITEYESKIAAANALNISIATLGKYLLAEGNPVFIGDIQVKLKSDETPWNLDIDLNNIVYHEFHSRRVLVIDLLTNITSIYNSMVDCALALGVSKDTIQWRLKNAKSPILLDRYKLQFLNQ